MESSALMLIQKKARHRDSLHYQQSAAMFPQLGVVEENREIHRCALSVTVRPEEKRLGAELVKRGSRLLHHCALVVQDTTTSLLAVQHTTKRLPLEIDCED